MTILTQLKTTFQELSNKGIQIQIDNAQENFEVQSFVQALESNGLYIELDGDVYFDNEGGVDSYETKNIEVRNEEGKVSITDDQFLQIDKSLTFHF